MSEAALPFQEATPDTWSKERDKLLQREITALGLKIEGTYLEPIVGRLYEELEGAGIKLKPKVYLADEWACPDLVPVIGIPFYLADPRLMRIEDEMMDGVEAQTEQEILGYLRHEAGHAFNYAYKLYETERWRELFGDMFEPYNEDYKPEPFSRDFVRNIPGWYAQKHPDEDFAETFAVWLTPGSDWRSIYKDWGCFAKLSYCDAIVKQIGQADPIVSGDDYDFASEALTYSIAEYYRRVKPRIDELPAEFDQELAHIFRPRAGSRGPRISAYAFLLEIRRELIQRIAYWTGLYDVTVRGLILHVIGRSEHLDLGLNVDDRERVLVDLVAFASALCMNHLYNGRFASNSGSRG